ncbi:P1 family peptidase [Peptacetobacter hiranonis]|uniref:P1 family peptidase n=1 Tax=Peptacetobacter hiranonis TaxID=89152 RepID=UPI0019179B4F|nr:P1 family peptidase [Peptacetobacter hiranonis]QQQ86432.1 P1 family peptidase [Peptacetobacter hiranonis]
MESLIKEISIKEIDDVSIGHAQNDEAKTGVSVIYFKNGAQAGCDISGGGPASRETPLTSSMTADNPLNAVVLSGGSAFGLAASDGVMRCLEERGIGFDTGFAKVPLVCQSCIFDLGYGKSDVRPDADMGYEACVRALEGCDDSMGNIGAGTGASVGKLLGMKQAMKSGLGVHAIQVGDLKIAAVVVVNAFGDIFDSSNAQKIAGLMDPERKVFWDLEETFVKMVTTPQNLFKTNTTIGCVVCNAKFDKAKLNKIASMTRNAYARCINPVGTMADGDSIYACSIGEVVSDVNVVGSLAAKVMEKAIKKAVESAKIDDEEYLKNCL